MNLDTAIFAQIQPLVYESKKLGLKEEDGKALVAELYMSMYQFYNNDLKKYRGRIDHLESLKAGKEFEFVENLSNQQKDIVDESEEKKTEILCKIYNEFVDKHFNKIEE